MFYEKFDLDGTDSAAEYQTEDLIITYMMQHMMSPEHFMEIVTEEWMHGLIDWALEGKKKTTESEDHYVLRAISFGI